MITLLEVLENQVMGLLDGKLSPKQKFENHKVANVVAPFLMQAQLNKRKMTTIETKGA